MSDLVQRLQQAASAAIAAERPALTSDADGRVVGLTVELVIGPGGALGEATVYVERRISGGALMARRVAS